jgi:ABC-2 type transport system permease protein
LPKQLQTMMIRKYRSLFSISWQNGLVYKTSFFLWQLRQLLATILPLVLWSAVYTSNEVAFGYTQGEMIGYIIITGLLQSIIMATGLHEIPRQVYSGDLSMILARPLGVFQYAMIVDLADKLKNILVVLVVSVGLWALMQPVVPGFNWSLLPLLVLWIVGGVIVHFYIEMLFGSIGFWSPDVWGPKFIFFMLVELAAGRTFPLDILPETIQKIIYLTPFPMLGFVQTQLTLGRLPYDRLSTITLTMLGWCIVLGFGCLLIWRRGLKSYAAAGR